MVTFDMMNYPRYSRIWLAAEWLCRLVVAGVFLLAGAPKLLDPTSFAKAITNYKLVLPLIGQAYVYPVAIVMPALEVVAALALLLNRWKRAGALVSGGLLLFFAVMIAQAMLRGFNIDCGCFGAGAVGKAMAQKVGVEKILENLLWAAMCGFVFWRGRGLLPAASVRRREKRGTAEPARSRS